MIQDDIARSDENLTRAGATQPAELVNTAAAASKQMEDAYADVNGTVAPATVEIHQTNLDHSSQAVADNTNSASIPAERNVRFPLNILRKRRVVLYSLYAP